MKTWETEIPALPTLRQLPWQGHQVNCMTPKGTICTKDNEWRPLELCSAPALMDKRHYLSESLFLHL